MLHRRVRCLGRFGFGHLFSWRRSERLVTHHPHSESFERIRFADQLSVVVFEYQRKTRALPRVVHQHRQMSGHVALDVRRFVSMMLAAPDKYSKAVELIGFESLRDRGPEPIALLHIAFLHLA